MATRVDERSPSATDTGPRGQARVALGMGEGDDVDSNVGRLATSRHVAEGRRALTAIRWFGRDDAADEPVDISYEMLEHRTNRFAGALRRRGFAPGSGVATIAGRIPELYVAALGALKAGCVYAPLLATLDPEQIAQRLAVGKIRVVVTTPVLFRRRVATLLGRLPDLELILIVGATEDTLADVLPAGLDPRPAVMSYGLFLSEGHDTFEAPPTPNDTPALLHFTSGSSGAPEVALREHGDVVAHVVTARDVLDIRQGVVSWCTADPGWLAGTSYGIIAPLVLGATTLVDEADFDAPRWRRMLAANSVEILFVAPTAMRVLQRVGAESTPPEFPDLRVVASVGDPLASDALPG